LAQHLGIGYGTVAMARPRNPALARRGVQILHRSLTGRQGHRHRRALPGFPENAIVLPAARTRTSGPACGNNTSPPRTTPFPRQKQTKLGNNHLNSAVARRAARAHNHFPSRETSQPTPTGTAAENPVPGCWRPTQPVNPHRPAPSRCGRSNPVRGVGDESAGLRDVPVAPTARQRRARAARRPKGCAPRHGRHNPVVGTGRLMPNSI
jgi:hypothetical protein